MPANNRSKPNWNLPIALCLMASVALIAGCSSNANKAVKGKVVYKGKPVYPGTVVLQGDGVKMQRVNLNSEGEFFVSGIEMTSYSIAIQTQKLGKRSSSSGRTNKPTSKVDGDGEAEPPRREDTRPDKFKNSNVEIPERYSKLSTTPLSVDFRSFNFDTTLELVLERK